MREVQVKHSLTCLFKRALELGLVTKRGEWRYCSCSMRELLKRG